MIRVGSILALAIVSVPMAAASAEPPYQISSVGVLHKSDLLLILSTRLRHMDNDPFTGETTARFGGRKFQLFQTPQQANGVDYPETNSRWTYDIPSHTLKLTTDTSDIEFYYKEGTSHYVGRTDRGLKKRVTVDDRQEGAIVPTNSVRPLEVAVKVVPEEARVLSRNTVLVVEGILEPVSGMLTECNVEQDGSATVGNPTDSRTLHCRVHATITRLAFMDARTDKVLGEWTRDSETAAIKEIEGDYRWVTPPSLISVYDLFPERALRLEKNGEAVIKCFTRANGTVGNCAVVSESPAGYDFGSAAIRAAARLRIATPVAEGIAVTVPLHWKLR